MNKSQIGGYLVTSVLLPNTRKKTAHRDCDNLDEVKAFIKSESTNYECNHFIIDTNTSVEFNEMEKFLAPLDLAVEFRDIPLKRYLDNILYAASDSAKNTLKDDMKILLAGGTVAGGEFLGGVVALEASKLVSSMGEEALSEFFGEAAETLFNFAGTTLTVGIPVMIGPKLLLKVGMAVYSQIKANRKFRETQERLEQIPFRRFVCYRDHDFRSDELYGIGLAKAA